MFTSIRWVLAAAVWMLFVSVNVEGAMVSYWNYDSKSGTTISDLTVSGHDGTLVGGANITAGNLGYGGSGEALTLTGNGQRMSAANPTNFDFNSSFTWTAMVKTSDGSGAIFSRNPAGTAWNQGSNALFVRGNNVQWDTGWVGNPNTGINPTDNQWHQVVATFDAGTDKLDILVDGATGYSNTFNVNQFNEHTNNHNGGFADTSFTVGEANFSGGLSSLDTLVGLIDDAAVFDTNLTGAELDQLIRLGPASFLPAPPPTGVPEPASIAIWALLGLAGFGYSCFRRRSKK